MEKIKIIIFDIDGTLIANGKKEIESSALEALNQVKAKGYHILIATGRTYYLIQEDIKARVKPDYYVTINGGCLTDGEGNTIEAYRFTENDVKVLREYINENELLMGLKHETIVTAVRNHLEFTEKYLGDDLRHHYIIDDSTPPYYSEKDLPMGAFIFAPRYHLEKIKALLPDIDVVYAVGDTLEAFPSGVDKSKTIESVLNHYGYSWENAAVFGDAGNDTAMLEKAGLGIAMGNAEDFVKAHADYVTSSVTEDGIYKALKHFKFI